MLGKIFKSPRGKNHTTTRVSQEVELNEATSIETNNGAQGLRGHSKRQTWRPSSWRTPKRHLQKPFLSLRSVIRHTKTTDSTEFVATNDDSTISGETKEQATSIIQKEELNYGYSDAEESLIQTSSLDENCTLDLELVMHPNFSFDTDDIDLIELMPVDKNDKSVFSTLVSVEGTLTKSRKNQNDLIVSAPIKSQITDNILNNNGKEVTHANVTKGNIDASHLVFRREIEEYFIPEETVDKIDEEVASALLICDQVTDGGRLDSRNTVNEEEVAGLCSDQKDDEILQDYNIDIAHNEILSRPTNDEIIGSDVDNNVLPRLDVNDALNVPIFIEKNNILEASNDDGHNVFKSYSDSELIKYYQRTQQIDNYSVEDLGSSLFDDCWSYKITGESESRRVDTISTQMDNERTRNINEDPARTKESGGHEYDNRILATDASSDSDLLESLDKCEDDAIEPFQMDAVPVDSNSDFIDIAFQVEGETVTLAQKVEQNLSLYTVNDHDGSIFRMTGDCEAKVTEMKSMYTDHEKMLDTNTANPETGRRERKDDSDVSELGSLFIFRNRDSHDVRETFPHENVIDKTTIDAVHAEIKNDDADSWTCQNYGYDSLAALTDVGALEIEESRKTAIDEKNWNEENFYFYDAYAEENDRKKEKLCCRNECQGCIIL